MPSSLPEGADSFAYDRLTGIHRAVRDWAFMCIGAALSCTSWPLSLACIALALPAWALNRLALAYEKRGALEAVHRQYAIELTGAGGLGLRHAGKPVVMIEFRLKGGSEIATGFIILREGRAWVESADDADGNCAVLNKDGAYVWKKMQ